MGGVFLSEHYHHFLSLFLSLNLEHFSCRRTQHFSVMGKLDARGVIAVLEVIIYIPVLCTSVFLVKRHGFRRTAGWILFVLFSLSKYLKYSPSKLHILTFFGLPIVRIIGSIVHIASEVSNSANSMVHIIYSILEGAGLQPLLGATLGFLATMWSLSLLFFFMNELLNFNVVLKTVWTHNPLLLMGCVCLASWAQSPWYWLLQGVWRWGTQRQLVTWTRVPSIGILVSSCSSFFISSSCWGTGSFGLNKTL